MNSLSILLVGVVVALAAIYAVTRLRLMRLERERFIRSYVFPASLLTTLHRHHGHLVDKDYYLVARALREFFLVRLRAGDQFIGMPSRVVDDLWHEFILRTHDYERFCKSAFGRFFHHFPATATPKGADMSNALRVTWRYACLEENINPNNAARLPLLFAIDEKLQIVDGFRYKRKNQFRDNSDSGGDGCGGSACGGGRSGKGDGDFNADGDGGCGGGCGGD